MGAIGSALASLLSHNPTVAAQTPAPAPAQASAGAFGDATDVTLSAAAQGAAGGQQAASGTAGNAAPAPSSGGAASGASKAPVAVSSASSSSTSVLVEEAKRKVAAEVGVTGASEVVDSKGDIDYTKLDQLLARQALPASA